MAARADAMRRSRVSPVIVKSAPGQTARWADFALERSGRGQTIGMAGAVRALIGLAAAALAAALVVASGLAWR